MLRNKGAHLVPSIAGLTTAAIALWFGMAQPLAAHDAPARDDSKSLANIHVVGNLTTNNSDANAPATGVAVTDRPPIACKVAAKGVLTDCRINEGYNLNDVANWFQDDHDRTLQLAVNSVTLAKKFEHSLESCTEEKGKK